MRRLATSSLAMIALALSFAASGCADKQAPPPELPPPPTSTATPTADADADGATRIRRPMLDAVLQQGPGWLLERVPVEEVLEKGKFVGWRVLDLPADWAGIELKPGDVVTRVNAMPIETPGDFWAAWTTLSVASELMVAYVRDGEAHQLSMPIEGSPDPALSRQLQKQQGKTPPPRGDGSRRPHQKRTIIIKGEDRPLSDTNVDWSR